MGAPRPVKNASEAEIFHRVGDFGTFVDTKVQKKRSPKTAQSLKTKLSVNP